MGDEDLRSVFEQYGTVDSAKIISDHFSGKSRGFGFVEMTNDAEAQRAIDELNGGTIEGRKIVVNKSEPKPHDAIRQSAAHAACAIGLANKAASGLMISEVSSSFHIGSSSVI